MRFFAVLATSICLAVVVVIGGEFRRSFRPFDLASGGDQPLVPADPVDLGMSVALPLMVPPKIMSQDGARDMAEGAPVVGITLGGRYRAYVLDKMQDDDMLFVADELGGVPVAVVYSPELDRARVFTHPQGSQLSLAAVRRGNNVWLHYGGNAFPFASADINTLVEQRHTRTTWGEWRELHPDSDLCVGTESTELGRLRWSLSSVPVRTRDSRDNL